MSTFGGHIKRPWLPKVESRTLKPRPRQLWKQWLHCCRQSTNKCSPSGPSPLLLTAIKRGPAGPNLLQGRGATAVGSIGTAGISKNGERSTDEETNRCTVMIILQNHSASLNMEVLDGFSYILTPVPPIKNNDVNWLWHTVICPKISMLHHSLCLQYILDLKTNVNIQNYLVLHF